MNYDLIIIGGGPAAMSAGIYAARKKIKTLLIAKQLGGQPAEAWEIENYLGFEKISGVDLAQKFASHLKKFSADIEIQEGENAEKITKNANNEFEVSAGKKNYLAKAIIIATGSSPRRLNIAGEENFIGRGVVFCATCDAPLFAGKTVAVIGAGNSGMDTALQLTKYAKKIYLINKYPDLLKGDSLYAEQIKNSPLVEIMNNSLPKEIRGDKFVSGLIIENSQTKENKELSVEGIFVEIGSLPSLQFLGGLVEYNQKGEIIINHENNMSSCAGIFAAGDATNVPHKQIIIAAGEGAKAALGAYYYLQHGT
jgi:alkyl hydroperoxide reductase subunit F